MSKAEFLLLVTAAAVASIVIRLWIDNAPGIAGSAGLPVAPRVPTGSAT